MSLTNSLSKIHILNEAPDDDLFDIDKEVDAQIKRVQNRIERSQERQNPPTSEQDQSNQEDDNQDQPEEASVDDQNQEDQNIDDRGEDSDTQEEDNGDGDYEYMDSGTNIPDDYEPKQSIPELKILSTLSDSEYALNNVRILEQFKSLRNNIDSTIKNIVMNIVTKNSQQRQIMDIVHNNLYDMINDIDNFILYRNNDIYEENVTTYCTFLKRYKIATDIIKIIVEENLHKK